MDIQEARKKMLRDMRVDRWHHPTLRCHFWAIVQGFAELADGLVTVLSLGFLMSNFEMQIAFYRSISHHILKKNQP